MDAPGSMRLSTLGSDASAVLAVIGYFDRFDESAANADTVVRAAALLAECAVGARWSSGTVIRYDAAGRLLPDGEAAGGEADPSVWVERSGAAHALDGVLLDRLRHCLRVVAASRSVSGPLRMDDPALLEVVLSSRERREDRVRALRLLGFDPAGSVRVLAVSGPGAADAVDIVAAHVRVVRTAEMGSTTALLIQGGAVAPDRRSSADGSWRAEPGVARAASVDASKAVGAAARRADFDGRQLSDLLNSAVVQSFPSDRTGSGGPWVGMGERLPAVAAATSWEQARRALRFASSTWHGRRVIAFDRLGSLELLTELPVRRLLGCADVVRVNEFAETAAGALAVDTLEAFCVFGSLRRTAAELHLHHSTVAARIAQVEAVMGWDVDEALDRFMATLVLTVRRITLSSAALAAGRADVTRRVSGGGAEFGDGRRLPRTGEVGEDRSVHPLWQ